MPLKVKVKSRQPVAFAGKYAGMEKYFPIECLHMEVNGHETDHLIWENGDAVQVVAITKEGKVLLVREFKKAVNKVLFGLPAGAIEENETPEEAAIRELRQETGYIGDKKKCKVIGPPYYTSPSKMTERHFIVLVFEVEEGESEPEDTETIIEIQLGTFREAKSKISMGPGQMAVRVVEDFFRENS